MIDQRGNEVVRVLVLEKRGDGWIRWSSRVGVLRGSESETPQARDWHSVDGEGRGRAGRAGMPKVEPDSSGDWPPRRSARCCWAVHSGVK